MIGQGLDDFPYTLYPGPLGVPIGPRFQAFSSYFFIFAQTYQRSCATTRSSEQNSICWRRRTFCKRTIATDILLYTLQISLTSPIDRLLMFQRLSNLHISIRCSYRCHFLSRPQTGLRNSTVVRDPCLGSSLRDKAQGFCS